MNRSSNLTETRKAIRLARSLERKHKISDDFYPGCSFHLQIAGGLTGDVIRNVEMLSKVGEPARSDTILNVMQAKRVVMRYYSSNRTESVQRFGSIIVEKVRPIGGISPVLYELAQSILVILAVYGGIRFLGSFSSEAGKIAARRLFEKRPEESASELKIHVEVVNFLKSEISELSELSELSERQEFWQEIGSLPRRRRSQPKR